MNGSEILKAVIDTNVIFMAVYNPESKAGKIIKFVNKNKILLFSPDVVKSELLRVLKRELGMSDDEINFIIDRLPISWIDKEIYKPALNKTKVKHKADKPSEALSLILNCKVLSADFHFKERMNINKLIEMLEK